MPSGDIGWRGEAFRELIRRVALLVLDELRETFSAFLIVVELKEAELGGADGSADENCTRHSSSWRRGKASDLSRCVVGTVS